jgi:hypothetical protein
VTATDKSVEATLSSYPEQGYAGFAAKLDEQNALIGFGAKLIPKHRLFTRDIETHSQDFEADWGYAVFANLCDKREVCPRASGVHGDHLFSDIFFRSFSMAPRTRFA